MFDKPQAEHQFLQQLVGEWTFEGECFMGPDKPKEKMSGTESVRSVGGMFVVCEGKGKDPTGEDCTMHLTIGYDPAIKKYVGTWFGSMMARLWVYDISRDGNTLNMDSDGPAFDDPKKTVRYRDAIEIKSPDERLFTSSVKGDDGNWFTFMTSTYRRMK